VIFGPPVRALYVSEIRNPQFRIKLAQPGDHFFCRLESAGKRMARRGDAQAVVKIRRRSRKVGLARGGVG
jgi:hypothetical protein